MDTRSKARAQRRTIAAATLTTCTDGSYLTSDGCIIDIASSISYSVANTVFHPPEYKPRVRTVDNKIKTIEVSTSYEVANEGALHCARRLTAAGNSVAILNFASARNPGGGFLNGAEAQEENLARNSTLYAAQIGPQGRAFYDLVASGALSDGLYTHALLYSPRVPVFRDDRPDGETLDEPWLSAFITAAAPNAGVARTRGVADSVIEQTFMERAARVLAVAAGEGHDTLVLGAWGCGVFKNDPSFVAGAFRKLLSTKFRNVFRHVAFAILGADSTRAPFVASFGGACPAGSSGSSISGISGSSGCGGSSGSGGSGSIGLAAVATKVAEAEGKACSSRAAAVESSGRRRLKTRAERRTLQEAQRAQKAEAKAEKVRSAEKHGGQSKAARAAESTGRTLAIDSAASPPTLPPDLSNADLPSTRRHVLLVRHGEGTHNARPSSSASAKMGWLQRSQQVDPRLTDKGREQAAALSDHPLLSSVDLLVVSPLSRAIQTAALAFGERPQPSRCRRVVLTPLHSERWTAPCDEGRPKSELAADFPFVRSWEGYGELPEAWWPNKATDADWVTRRVPAFLDWLDAQPGQRIVVVGHGAFFGVRALLGRHLRNCEVALLTAAAGASPQQLESQEVEPPPHHRSRARVTIKIVVHKTPSRGLDVDVVLRAV